MFSTLTEHAMRVAVFLADGPQRAHAVDAIVAGTRISAAELREVTDALVAGRVIVQEPGEPIRFRLSRSPEAVTMFDISQCTAPLRRIEMCPLGLEGHGPNLCPLHRRMANAVIALETAYRKSTLAQLLVEPTTSKPLCNFPRLPA